MDILREEHKDGKLKGQLHSFSGDIMMAEECVNMGLYISFTGNITYKPNDKTLLAYEIIQKTPLENILLETDTPYLPPMPFRGKHNEPAYVKYTAEKIAELKNISVEELGKVSTQNAKKLFGIE
jgi:TatD DNase family protein